MYICGIFVVALTPAHSTLSFPPCCFFKGDRKLWGLFFFPPEFHPASLPPLYCTQTPPDKRKRDQALGFLSCWIGLPNQLWKPGRSERLPSSPMWLHHPGLVTQKHWGRFKRLGLSPPLPWLHMRFHNLHVACLRLFPALQFTGLTTAATQTLPLCQMLSVCVRKITPEQEAV